MLRADAEAESDTGPSGGCPGTRLPGKIKGALPPVAFDAGGSETTHPAWIEVVPLDSPRSGALHCRSAVGCTPGAVTAGGPGERAKPALRVRKSQNDIIIIKPHFGRTTGAVRAQGLPKSPRDCSGSSETSRDAVECASRMTRGLKGISMHARRECVDRIGLRLPGPSGRFCPGVLAEARKRREDRQGRAVELSADR